MAQTILVVDDEAKLRQMIRVYLEQENYRVVEAGNGRDALYVAREAMSANFRNTSPTVTFSAFAVETRASSLCASSAGAS